MGRKLNHVAIVVAAVADFMLGGVWYGTLSTRWMIGIGKTMDELRKDPSYPLPWPYILGFATKLLAAYVLAALIGSTGRYTAGRGVRLALLMWLGFVFTSTLNEYAFEGRGLEILAINTGYQLLALVVAGAIIGAWAPKGGKS